MLYRSFGGDTTDYIHSTWEDTALQGGVHTRSFASSIQLPLLQYANQEKRPLHNAPRRPASPRMAAQLTHVQIKASIMSDGGEAQ